MSETLAGVTIVAIGNAGPDIASSFAAFGSRSAEQSGLVYGSFLGGGMMVMSVLVGVISFMNPFRNDKNYILNRYLHVLYARSQWYIL